MLHLHVACSVCYRIRQGNAGNPHILAGTRKIIGIFLELIINYSKFQLHNQQNKPLNNFIFSSTADIVDLYQLEPSIHTPFAHTIGLIGCQCFVCALAHAEKYLHLCVCVCVYLFVCRRVGGCVGVRGMQVNSLRGPTAPQASLAHHLTAIPDEGLRTNELVKQMSEQAREGWGWRVGARGCCGFS